MRWMHWTVIFHRDLKAENLLLDSSLNIKIAGTWFCSKLCLSLSVRPSLQMLDLPSLFSCSLASRACVSCAAFHYLFIEGELLRVSGRVSVGPLPSKRCQSSERKLSTDFSW